ncbi:MAG TPA: hypothetical protein VF432_26410 [Thermoanaerobaculia bacterium]
MRTFVALVLFALTFPAAAAPFALRSEVPVSEPMYGMSKEISRAHARIVTNGEGYLAVWTDWRENDEPSVYAARMQADGTLLDPLGVRIVNDALAGPVVWTGSKYLIAYETRPYFDSYVRTMTLDGVLGEPIPVGHSAHWGSMATNGTNVLLVLPDRAMLLDLEGHKLRDVPLAKLEREYYYTRVAAAGSTYLVAAAMPAVVVQTVTTDGAVGAPLTLASPKEYTLVGLATDGERFLVVWPEKQLYGQLVTTAGTTAGPVHTLAAVASANFPAAEWRDGEYLVLFSERSVFAHFAVRVAADGSALTQPKKLETDYTGEVDVAAHGRGGIALFGRMEAAVFDDASLAGDEVFRRTVDVAMTALPQHNVRLARLGDGYVAAWGEGGRILLSTAAGSTPVAVAGSTMNLIDVLVDRSNILWVIWQDSSSRGIGLSRFWGDLTAVDPGPIYFQTPGYVSVNAAAAGDGVIALAYEYGDDNVIWDITAMLLWETGTGIQRKDLPLTTEQFADYGPTVTFDGSAFVYGWSHATGAFPTNGMFPNPEIELVAARVSPGGDLLDTTPVRIADDIGMVSEIDSALGARGVAFAWQADERSTRAALFSGAQLDLGGSHTRLGELAPHHGGFLLLRGTARRLPRLTEAEYVVLGADLSIAGTGTLPPYAAGGRYPFDIDVIGGNEPVFAYTKLANDSKYGQVSRVFVRRTGEASPRRRALR